MTKMKIAYLGHLRTECTHESGVKIETDAPKEIGGNGGAFSPTDLLAVSLGSCMVTLMAIHAQRLGIELKGLSAEVEKEMTSVPHRKVGKIVVRMRSPLSPSAEIREKLEKAALTCPVHHSLHPDVKLEIDFVWGL